MTDAAGVVPPGQSRLFAVAASERSRLHVLSIDGHVVVRTGDLAAAVIAAASEPDGGWVVAPDRWSARVVAADNGWMVSADAAAPVDAIRRVLALIEAKETST